MDELIREDIVIKLGARVDGEGEGESEDGGEGEGEGIGGGDAAGHGGTSDIGGQEYEGGCNSGENGLRPSVKEKECCKEGCKGGCNSGEKGLGSSVKEVRFFFFLSPSSLSAVIARVFGAIGFC